MTDARTIVFFPEGAYGPTNNCVGIGQVTLPTLFKGGSVEVLPKVEPGLVLERVSAPKSTVRI